MYAIEEHVDGRRWRRVADELSVSLLAGHDHDQGVAVLDVHGEIDLETAPLLRQAPC